MPRFERLLASLLTVVATAPLAAWPAAAQRPSATVQVQVLHGGSPVRGLSAPSFTVREEGRKVPVVAIREIDLVSPGAAPPELAPRDRRHLLLLYDLPALTEAALAEGSAAARELLSHAVLPADSVALAVHRGAGEVELRVAPTTDRRAVLDAVTELGAASADDPPARAAAGAGPLVTADSALAAADSGRETDLGIVQQRQAEIHALIRALARLVELSHAVSGHTAVVLFSRGFDSSAILGNPATRARDWAYLSDAAEAAAVGEPWRVNSTARFGGGMVENALFHTLDEYRRTGRAIHVIDLADTPPRGQGPEGLRLLAARTRGSFADTAAELTAAVAEALQRTAVSYLVTFEPRKPRRSGYRRLDIRISGTAQQPTVVHPRGYYRSPPGR